MDQVKFVTRVLVLVSRLRIGVGGVAAYFRCLENYLCHRARYLSIGGEHTTRTTLARTQLLVSDCRRLVSELRKRDLQVVHLNPSMVWKAFFREAVHLAVSRMAGKKVLVFWHGWDWRFAKRVEGGMRRAIFSWTFARAACHIVLAARFREHLRKLNCRGAILLESTVVGDEILGASPRPPRGKGDPLRLLFLSRIEKEKGIYIAIDSVEVLQRKGRLVQLTVAGDGSERIPAEQYVARRQLDGIKFVGYVRGDEKKQLLAESDLYLFPSNHGEGMPLSVLEAMAVGLPVICTRAGGLDDFFADGVMGYSVVEPSTDAFVSLVERCGDNPADLVRFGEHNRDYAAKYFLAPMVGRRLFAIYDFLLSESESTAAPPDWMRAPAVEVDPCAATRS